MKKIVLAIAVVALISSCKKKEKEEGPCNCGIIQSDNVQDYSVVIKNECSGNNKTFTLSSGDWMNAHVGSNYCITNSGKW
jgi:nitrous oxide reductase accessory protein NosL